MHKANIQGNQEQRPRYPRLIGRSTWNNREEGLGFYAGSWWGWFVLREGAPPNKGNQGKTKGKPRETKEKPRETKENQGKAKEKPRKTKKNQGKAKENQGKTKGNQGNKENPFNQ